jgi:hypothetical protein
VTWRRGGRSACLIGFAPIGAASEEAEGAGLRLKPLVAVERSNRQRPRRTEPALTLSARD